MSTKAGTAYVDVEGKFDDLQRGVARQADDIRSSLGGAFKSVVLGAGALFAGVKIGGFLKDAVGEFQESAKIGRLTEAVIKSTGAAAGVSAGQVDQLAQALAAKSGVDDEVIASGENVLLTFTNVKNAVGEGNDVFTQATGLALDMSAALGQDMQSSVLQLGKALNDPIKGMTALGRAGVQLNAEQREQIKTFVESGDVLGAQKVILAELGKEFGGAAQAAADPLAQLQVVVGNFKEELGGALFPAVQQIAPVLGQVLTTVGPILGTVLGQVSKTLGPIVTSLAPVLEQVGRVVGVVIAAIGPSIGDIVAAIAPVLGALGEVLVAFAPLLQPVARVIAIVVKALAGGLVPAIKALADAITPIVRAMLPPLNAALDELAPIIAQVGKTVGRELAVAFRQLAPVLAEVAGTLAGALGEALKAIAPSLPELSRSFVEMNTAMLPLVVAILPPLADLLALILPPLGKLIGLTAGTTAGSMHAFAEAWRAISNALVDAGHWIVDVGGKLGELLAPVGSALGSVVGFAGGVKDALTDAVSWVGDKIGQVVGFFSGLPGRIAGFAGAVLGAARNIGQKIIDGIGQGLSGVAGFAGDIAGAVARALKRAINGIIDLLNDAIPDKLGRWPLEIDLPNNPIPKLHTGGIFQAPPGQSEGLAILRNDEIVTTPEDAAAARRSGPLVQTGPIYAWDAREAAQALMEEAAWARLSSAGLG